ncbi:nitrogen regulation protein NR(II) [Thalassotalea mangrovi]|uniref:Sensory histidine kinase/phosphatase NtrB n=1 Tax=Thalassotalea mangrovi TaxID=2572245 RepID=A0A4U1B2V5_9GAMM|nr:nitrogen regulation protein NR(II) [Thalassotalea mangrovi]TKB43989.1 nitrogen regulation protein NR(II) [Thalassotalea mangrovi]
MHNSTQLKDIRKYYQQQLVSQLGTAVVVLNSRLEIKYLNPAAEAIFNKSLNRLLNKPFVDSFLHCSLQIERLEQVVRTGQDFTDSDVIIEFIDNARISLEVSATVIRIDGKTRVLLECKQIDKQKQINTEMFQEQQWQAARDLIRGLAHEIKNPLGGLRGAAQLLDRELNEEQREFTSLIIAQADRLTNLVDRLLGPNQLPNLSLMNIHQVLETVYRLKKLDNAKNIQFVRDYDPSIPDILIDPEKLQQTLLNIIGNALQVLNEQGKITLKTRIATNQTINGEKVKLAIKISIIDNGPGIPPALQDKIFYPMVSGRANGTGLGLSIAQTLVHQHQGKLACHSYPGRTEFSIILPLPKRSNQ